MENKTSKYFKYALGEIILVMIGILLALAINNWNTDRQLKANNKLYLNKMLNDLNATKHRLKIITLDGSDSENSFGYPSLEQVVKDCDSLLKLTYKGLDVNDINYFVTTNFDAGGSLLNISDNTYKEMLNTGRIYTLKSDTLTNAITNYYKMCEREAEYNVLNSESVRRGMVKFGDGFGKLKMDYWYNKFNFNLKDYPFYLDRNSKAYKDFQVGLRLMYFGQRNNMRKMLFIIEETNQLITTITDELKQYD